MAKRKTKAELQAATDKVNKARREKYAAKHGITVEAKADDKAPADKAAAPDKTPPPTKAKDGAAVSLLALAIDRGVLLLDIVPDDMTNAEIIEAAIATGHVRYNDILFIINPDNSKVTKTLITLNPLQL